VAGVNKKTAVVLFNLGGPDSVGAIRPFLFNFFTDRNIIRLPFFLRWPLATLIAVRRSKREAGTSYGLIGGRSPLLDNTEAQRQALEKMLGDDYRVFISMRYWHPMAADVAPQVKAYTPDHVVLLPLYPQYSTTTTRSSYQAWQKAARDCGLASSTALVCCYPQDDGFISASVHLVGAAYDQALAAARSRSLPAPRVLFSAHGLPESIIADGDPYQWQCEQTMRAILERRAVPELDFVLCYQSRVGRQRWLGPSTEEEIRRAGLEGRPVVIYPLAFTQEHVETLAEIEIEYRHVAETAGVPLFLRVPTVGVDESFIAGLARMVRDAAGQTGIAPAGGVRICPSTQRRCCCIQDSKGEQS